MKLISMTEFVLEQERQRLVLNLQPDKNIANEQDLKTIVNYAKLLSMPFELKMFVPCWYRNGIYVPIKKEDLINTIDLFKEFEKAKEEVLFEGWKMNGCLLIKEYFNLEINLFYDKGLFELNRDGTKLKIIEDLVKYDLTLTQSAIEKYNL